MATTGVPKIWTAFLGAFRAAFLRVLAVLGVRTAPVARTVPVRTPVAPAPAASWTPGLIPAQAPAGTPARDLALPPTIKQRIRAEAHGSSPSVRWMRCDGDGDDAAGPASGPHTMEDPGAVSSSRAQVCRPIVHAGPFKSRGSF